MIFLSFQATEMIRHASISSLAALLSNIRSHGMYYPVSLIYYFCRAWRGITIVIILSHKGIIILQPQHICLGRAIRLLRKERELGFHINYATCISVYLMYSLCKLYAPWTSQLRIKCLSSCSPVCAIAADIMPWCILQDSVTLLDDIHYPWFRP